MGIAGWWKRAKSSISTLESQPMIIKIEKPTQSKIKQVI